MNLIHDPWIPVRYSSGRRSFQSPSTVFADGMDPVVAVASPRADLDGGIVQLLIGLLQTVFTPKDADDWLDLAESPPPVEEIALRLAPLAPSFELLGPAPRFQQDPRVPSAANEPWPVEKLLIDLGLGEGADVFARNGSVGALCERCVAAALANLQTSAPAGGRGNLTSLRGGGPLTTLVLPQTLDQPLWLSLWLNVLPANAFRHRDQIAQVTPQELFPWLRDWGPTEPARSPELTPEDNHPFQVFFAMPRRVWLGDLKPGGDCGLCGAADVATVTTYLSRPNGIRYSGAWRHPLSPYRKMKGQEPISVKGFSSGLGYRQWLGLVVSGEDAAIEPALTVARAFSDRDVFRLTGGEARLWAFGYAMDNMKALAWCDGLLPIYDIPSELQPAYSGAIRSFVEAALLVEYYLRLSFKKLIARRPKDVKREPAHIVARFWEDTEPAFFAVAAELLRFLRAGGGELAARQAWHAALVRAAFAIFEVEAGATDFRAVDPARVARAWNELRASLYGRKLKGVLELPIDMRVGKPKGSMNKAASSLKASPPASGE